MVSNFGDFEYREINFFSKNEHYHRGLQWYMNFFQAGDSNTTVFERSTHYFTDSRQTYYLFP